MNWPPQFPESTLAFSFLIALGVILIIQLCYFLFIYLKPGLKKSGENQIVSNSELPPVSVIVCAKNEEKNLLALIPLILDQDYPEFQLVIVNDNSWDDTSDILKAFQVSHPNLHVTNLDEDKQRMQGKKFALTLGIKAAKYERILLTDADCRPVSNNWIKSMMSNASNRDIVIGYSPYRHKNGFSNSFIRFDSHFGALNYTGMALAKMPYMGVGRNLSYDSSLFFKVGGFRSHMNIVSGDDDLFINQVANKSNTATVIFPESHMISEPKTTLNDWYKQKRRHLCTAPHYKAFHKILLSIFPLTYYLMWVLAGVLLVLHTHPLLVIGPIVLRYLVQFFIFRLSSRNLGNPDLSYKAWYLELFWMLVMPVVSMSITFRKPNAWS